MCSRMTSPWTSVTCTPWLRCTWPCLWAALTWPGPCWGAGPAQAPGSLTKVTWAKYWLWLQNWPPTQVPASPGGRQRQHWDHGAAGQEGRGLERQRRLGLDSSPRGRSLWSPERSVSQSDGHHYSDTLTQGFSGCAGRARAWSTCRTSWAGLPSWSAWWPGLGLRRSQSC